MQPRRTLAAALLAAAIVTAGAPAAHASTSQPRLLTAPAATAGNLGATGCGPSHGAEGQGGTGGTQQIVCPGAGLVFIGPSTAIDTVVGPTIISPGFAGIVAVSNGPVAVGP